MSYALGKRLSSLEDILEKANLKIFSCSQLRYEIRAACQKPHVKKYLSSDRYLKLLRLHFSFTSDVDLISKGAKSRDSKDDYLLDLCEQERVELLVTGDKDLLSLSKYCYTKIIEYNEFMKMISEEVSSQHYKEVLSSGINIFPMETEHAEQLEALQHKVFPNLAEEEILHADQYKKHLGIFPEGQFAALDKEKVVGATTTMRYQYDPDHPQHHTFSEIMGGGWLTTHDPHGEWLYGIDVSVDPAYRKMGIAKALYRARQHLCRQLELKGQLTVGMLNGYDSVRSEMTIEEYYEKVKRGEIFDPTVSVQMKIGFEIVDLMKDYLHDPTCENSGAVIVLRADKEI